MKSCVFYNQYICSVYGCSAHMAHKQVLKAYCSNINTVWCIRQACIIVFSGDGCLLPLLLLRLPFFSPPVPTLGFLAC